MIIGLNKIYLIIPIMTFILVCIITYKSLTYKSRIDTYEEYFIIIESKDNYKIDTNYETKLIVNIFKDIEINEYINCLNNKLTTEEFKI